MKKVAIIYHFYEADETYRDNLVFFLNVGIDDQADYFIFISGESSIPLIFRDNIKYIFIENKNHDYGGVVNFVKRYKDARYENYIFINSSMRGPFLPTYVKSFWYDNFLNRISGKIALVGGSINLLPETSPHSRHFSKEFDYSAPYIHVQTTAYAMSCDAFSALIDSGIFSIEEDLEKNEIISYYEIRITQELLRRGLSISSLLPLYEYFDNSKRNIEYKDTLYHGDPLYKDAFFGRSVHPYENIFVKTNRNMIDAAELSSLTFTTLALKEAAGGLSESGRDLLKRCHDEVMLVREKLDRKPGKLKRSMKTVLRKLKNLSARKK